MKKPANTHGTGKRGGKTQTSWKPGQSGNPAGRAKDGESWAAIVKTVGNMDVDDILKFVRPDCELGKITNKLPRGVQLKYLVVTRAFVSLINETTPNSGLLRELIDRAEGKVRDRMDINMQNPLTTEQRWAEISRILDTVYGRKEEEEGRPAPEPGKGPFSARYQERGAAAMDRAAQLARSTIGNRSTDEILDKVYGQEAAAQGNRAKPPEAPQLGSALDTVYGS